MPPVKPGGDACKPLSTPRLRPLDRAATRCRLRRPAAPLRLEAAWVDSLEDLREVQRLRFRVFAGEGGARLSPPPGTPPGHDADRFDAFCAHLMVRAIVTGEDSGEVVGTYRVLTPDAARRAGGFYSETEFDLAPLAPLALAHGRARPLLHPSRLAHRRHDPRPLERARRIHDAARPRRRLRLRQRRHERWRPRRRQPVAPAVRRSISPRPSAGSGRCSRSRSRRCATTSTSRRRR